MFTSNLRNLLVLDCTFQLIVHAKTRLLVFTTPIADGTTLRCSFFLAVASCKSTVWSQLLIMQVQVAHQFDYDQYKRDFYNTV